MVKNNSVLDLLFEAYRRNDMGDAHEMSKPLHQRWLGLGTKTTYAAALQAGVMTWINGREPPKRCKGWLVLTEKGVAMFNAHAHAEKFAAALKKLKKNPDYQIDKDLQD
jgi:hypothetical protein